MYVFASGLSLAPRGAGSRPARGSLFRPRGHIPIHVYICVDTRVHIHDNRHTHVQVLVQLHGRVPVHVKLIIYMSVPTDVSTCISMDMHMYICSCITMDIYTCTCTCALHVRVCTYFHRFEPRPARGRFESPVPREAVIFARAQRKTTGSECDY